MIAFLDAKAVIYLLEGSTEFSAQVRDTLKQLAAANSKLRLAVSELTRLECRVQPLRMADTQLLATYDTFFSLADLIQIPLSAQVIDLATVIRARHNLKTPDALQAACCLQLGNEHVFLGGDEVFQRVAGLHATVLPFGDEGR